MTCCVTFVSNRPRISYHSFIQSLIPLSVLQHAHNLIRSEFSTECDIVLPLSITSILAVRQGHPVAAYAFLIVFPSLMSFPVLFVHPPQDMTNPVNVSSLYYMQDISLLF